MHVASGDLWAGAEVQLYNLACAQHRTAGLDLSVILLNHGELAQRLHDAGVAVSVLDERRLNALQIGRQLLRHLWRVRPDIVHTHRHKENVLGSIAARCAGAKSLRSVHGRDEDDSPWWRLDKRLYRLLDRLCGRWLQQRVVAVSAQLAEELAADFPRRQIAVVENGIDAAALALAAAAGADLPGPPDRQRIAFVGRLVPVKRVDLFLQTAQELHQRYPGMFQFYIVGDGPQQQLCQQLIAQLGLTECVHMLGFRTNAAAVLAAMDLLLITSDHEGLPMTLLEAMSLEVAIVASAVGGIPQALGEGCDGLVYEQQPSAYVDAVLALLAEPRSRCRQTQQAGERVRQQYSAERNAAAYVDLYRQLRHGVPTRRAGPASTTETTGA